MPRNVASTVTNDFRKGLVTEATGLNFPDGAVTDSLNTQFLLTGAAQRRLGIDVEGSATAFAYDPTTDGVIKEFVWQAVALSGGFTFLVVQIGYNVNFFELTTQESLSLNKIPGAVDLRTYKAPGAGDIINTPASFAAGAGYLFISHPNCDPVVVKFDSQENAFKVAKISILVRDFEGVVDNLGVLENPSSLSTEHYYNLRNQGWNKNVRIGHNSDGNESSSEADTDPTINYSLVFSELS